MPKKKIYENERRDDGPSEQVPESNTATPEPDGPLSVHGNIRLVLPDGTTITETRVVLCRCGASSNKPFCDNSHRDVGFKDAGALGQGRLVEGDVEDPAGAVQISTAPNGPLVVRGPLEIRSADGSETRGGTKGSLCRCGASQAKPYCDGSHRDCSFEAD